MKKSVDYKEVLYTKCADYNSSNLIVRENIDLLSEMKQVNMLNMLQSINAEE